MFSRSRATREPARAGSRSGRHLLIEQLRREAMETDPVDRVGSVGSVRGVRDDVDCSGPEAGMALSRITATRSGQLRSQLDRRAPVWAR